MQRIALTIALGLLGGILIAQGHVPEVSGSQLLRSKQRLIRDLEATDKRIGDLRSQPQVDLKQLLPEESKSATIRMELRVMEARLLVDRLRTEREDFRARFTEDHPIVKMSKQPLRDAETNLRHLELEASLYSATESYVHQRINGSSRDASLHLAIAADTADAESRPKLLAQLAVLLEREGRFVSARRTLEELAQQSGPWAEWSRKRIGPSRALGAAPGQQDAPSALTRLILKLDEGGWQDLKTPAGRAYGDLERLGVLAHSALLAMLQKVGPVGRQAILDLLSDHEGKALDQAVMTLMHSKDAGWQELAARHISKVSEPQRTALALIALKSSSEATRRRGLYALADLGQKVPRVMQEVGRFARSPVPENRTAAAQLLAYEALRSHPDSRSILETLLADSDAGVMGRALLTLCRNASEKDQPEALDRLLRADPEIRKRTVFGLVDEMRNSQRPVWIDVLCLSVIEKRRRSSDINLLTATKQSVSTSNLARIVAANVPYGALEWATAKLAKRTGPDVAEVMKQLLAARKVNRGSREKAFLWLELHEPRSLAPAVTTLLREEHLLPAVVAWMARAAEPSMIPSIIDHYERYSTRRPGMSGTAERDLRRAIAWRSDATSLEALLHLARLPASSPNDLDSKAWMVQTGIQRWFGKQHVAPALNRIDVVLREAGKSILDHCARVVDGSHVGQISIVLNAHLEPAVKNTPVWTRRTGLTIGTRSPNSDLGSATETPVDAHVVVTACIDMLGKIATQESLASLEPLLSHDDSWVRGKATLALLRCKSADQVALAGRILREPPLQPFAEWVLDRRAVATAPELQALALKLLEAPPTMIIERDVHEYLRRVPLPQRRAFCKKVLHSAPTDDPIRAEIWQGALRALGDEKNETVIPDLARAFAHPAEDVRQDAAIQLGRTYSPKAVPVLLEALKDDSATVRQFAKASLTQIADYLRELEDWKELRQTGKK